VITPSGGELQGFPTARRVICESREATWLSLNGSSGDGWGAAGHDRPATCGRAASGTPLGIAFSWDTLITPALPARGRCLHKSFPGKQKALGVWGHPIGFAEEREFFDTDRPQTAPF
jgi:hypothetical protein